VAARRLEPGERRRLALLVAAVVFLHVLGIGLLLGTGVLGAGIGVTAYTLGMRRAFDADHIGAIDNTTRKLVGEGRRPLATGFFFSLGHSSRGARARAGWTRPSASGGSPRAGS
jgi:high-affinity nickel-transport protein